MGRFTIRVYGVVINNGFVLLSREEIRGKLYVKFPGGGLEYGEGSRDCLVRELKEETGLNAEVKEHIYTTDFFQPSAFHSEPTQVISIYYGVQLINPGSLTIISANRNEPGFFWYPEADMKPEVLDLPIDQYMVEKKLRR